MEIEAGIAGGGWLRRIIPPWCGSLGLQRDENSERRSFSLFAADIDKSVVLLDNAIHDRKSKAGPLADLLGGEEWFKDSFPGFLVHSEACVLSRKQGILPRDP